MNDREIGVVDVDDDGVGQGDEAHVVIGQDSQLEITAAIGQQQPPGATAAEAGLEVHIQSRRIYTCAGIDGKEVILALLVDKECYFCDAVFYGVFEDGFDVDLFKADGVAGKALYGVGQGRIVGILGLVNGVRDGGCVVSAVDNADFCDGIRGRFGDVEI